MRTQQLTHRSIGMGRIVVALTMVLAACAASVGVAGAAPVGGTAGAGAAAADFSAQAKDAGLNSTEAKGLQARADSRLAELGGTQVAANRIRFSGGELTLVLPGEKYARDLATTQGAQAAAEPCPYTYVCAYEGMNFTGEQRFFYNCNTLNYIDWVTTGSWKNNQRAALRAKFYDSEAILRWTSPGGYSEDPAADWRWVHYLSPC